MTAPQTLAQAIQQYLQNEISKDKNIADAQDKLQKAEEKHDDKNIAKLRAKIEELKLEYRRDTYFAALYAQISQFTLKSGTHISKGIHSSSKGDNIRLITNNITHNYIGTHSTKSKLIDINGNGAARTFVDLLNQTVGDTTIAELLRTQSSELTGAFHSDTTLSNNLQNYLENIVTSTDTPPHTTDERNKQTLWAITPETNHYHTLIPLYPSVLIHEAYQKIRSIRYSEANSAARANRFKNPKEPQAPYTEYLDFATIKQGGSKPQNVSQLNSKQAGQQILIPSLPPIFTADTFRLAQSTDSLFSSHAYHYQMQSNIDELVKTLTRRERDAKDWHDVNNKNLRDDRDAIVNDIIDQTIAIAIMLQEQPAGWSKTYKLKPEQKFWLDPNRSDEKFLARKQKTDWHNTITDQFADWLNSKLEERFKKRKNYTEGDFGLPEKNHWKSLFAEAIKASNRAEQGIFS